MADPVASKSDRATKTFLRYAKIPGIFCLGSPSLSLFATSPWLSRLADFGFLVIVYVALLVLVFFATKDKPKETCITYVKWSAWIFGSVVVLFILVYVFVEPPKVSDIPMLTDTQPRPIGEDRFTKKALDYRKKYPDKSDKEILNDFGHENYHLVYTSRALDEALARKDALEREAVRLRRLQDVGWYAVPSTFMLLLDLIAMWLIKRQEPAPHRSRAARS